MALLDKIGEIQKKPESTRYRILIASVTITMALIVTLWLSFPEKGSFSSIQIEGPFKIFWDNIKSIFNF